MIYKRLTDDLLNLNKKGTVFHFDGPYSYIEESALVGQVNPGLVHYVPTVAEVTAMRELYEQWLKISGGISTPDIEQHLNGDNITLYQGELLQILDTRSALFESNLNKDMFFTSSLGFKCNGDRRTKSNLQDLIQFFDMQAQYGSISYRDYDNKEQLLTKKQVETLLFEHVANGQALYTQKWTFQDLINSAQTLDDLNTITIEFKMADFRKG